MKPRPKQPTTIEELLDRVVVCPSGCWLWIGADSGDKGRGAGYGRILRPGTRLVMPAHRYVYEVFIGPIPRGFHVDHKCHLWGWHPTAHRRCVRPEHLEAVPPITNMERRNRAQALTSEMPLPATSPDLPAESFAPLLAPGESWEGLV